MAGILQKIRTLTLGATNDLLDKAIDMNSPTALRQYVRDLEDGLNKLETEAAAQAGAVRTSKRESEDLQHQIDAITESIKKLLAGDEKAQALARVKAGTVVALKQQLEQKKTTLVNQEDASAKIDAGLERLRAKHQAMVTRVRTLESVDRETKGKEQAASALNAAGNLLEGGADISIDDIQSKMRARNDVASEKFDRAMGKVTPAEDPETTSQVDSFLASLKTPAKSTSA
jgi:phage shock protein A